MPAAKQHSHARAWLADRFADEDSFVGLAWSALYSFARLVSNRRSFGDEAVDVPAASAAADAFGRQNTARIVEPGNAHHTIAAELMRTPGLSANDVPDVHLAALAMEHGLILCTVDHGFARFGSLRWENPTLTSGEKAA